MEDQDMGLDTMPHCSACGVVLLCTGADKEHMAQEIAKARADQRKIDLELVMNMLEKTLEVKP